MPVIGQFFALVADSLELDPTWRIGGGPSADFSVGVSEGDGGLVGPDPLRRRLKADLGRGARTDRNLS
jgi:hypothetical protein